MVRRIVVMLLLVLPSLAACRAHSTRLVDVDLSPAVTPQSARQPCPGVIDLPDRDLSSDESARLWAIDRQNLGECGARNLVLTTAINALEEQGGRPHSEGGKE